MTFKQLLSWILSVKPKWAGQHPAMVALNWKEIVLQSGFLQNWQEMVEVTYNLEWQTMYTLEQVIIFPTISSNKLTKFINIDYIYVYPMEKNNKNSQGFEWFGSFEIVHINGQFWRTFHNYKTVLTCNESNNELMIISFKNKSHNW